jgi:hypothetical protein
MDLPTLTLTHSQHIHTHCIMHYFYIVSDKHGRNERLQVFEVDRLGSLFTEVISF